MHGNVWEWCADWHAVDYYTKATAEDPVGPESGAGVCCVGVRGTTTFRAPTGACAATTTAPTARTEAGVSVFPGP